MVADFVAWLKAPLGTGPSAGTLFLFIGLVLIFIALWALIFRHIRAAV